MTFLAVDQFFELRQHFVEGLDGGDRLVLFAFQLFELSGRIAGFRVNLLLRGLLEHPAATLDERFAGFAQLLVGLLVILFCKQDACIQYRDGCFASSKQLVKFLELVRVHLPPPVTAAGNAGDQMIRHVAMPIRVLL